MQSCPCKRARARARGYGCGRVVLQLLHAVSNYEFDLQDNALARAKLRELDDSVWATRIGDDLLEDGFDAARCEGGTRERCHDRGMTGVVVR